MYKINMDGVEYSNVFSGIIIRWDSNGMSTDVNYQA